jgi:hypothetical protein
MKGTMKPQNAFVGFVCVAAFCKCALAVSKTLALRLRTANTTRMLPLVLLVTLPAAVQA